MKTKPLEEAIRQTSTSHLGYVIPDWFYLLILPFDLWIVPFLCFNQILDLIRMALDNLFERVSCQYPLIIYPGSTLWKMCANLAFLVIKIRQYYDKPPTISHIFILQWVQNIYDVEFAFLWYFRKTLSFNSMVEILK